MAARRCLTIFLFFVVLIIPMSLRAQANTFNAIFFKPALGNNAYFMLNSTDTLHKFQFNAGIFQSYAYHPLQLSDGTARIRGVIDNLLVSDFVLAFGVLEQLQIGVDFPLIEINKFKSPFDTTTDPLQNKFSIGDLRVEIKGRLVDPQKYKIGVALVPFMTAPTGKNEYYVGDDGITGGIKLALDGRVHKNILLTLNAGYQGGKKVVVRNVEFQHRFLLGGGVAGLFSKGLSVFGEVDAVTAFNAFFKDKDMNPAEAMVGVKWDVGKTGLTVQGGGGTCIICGTSGAKVQAVLGVGYRFNPPKYQEMDEALQQQYFDLFVEDTPETAIYSLRMNCPANPAEYQEGVSDPGCPKYYELRDVAGLVLRCPQKQEDFNPAKHDASCPKVFELSANYSPEDVRAIYNLSVVEMEVRCPSNAAEFNPTLHDASCPKFYTLKQAVDLASSCPSSSVDYRQGIDDAACPKLYELQAGYGEDQWTTMMNLAKKDTDRDGINDYLDRCPNLPEDKNGIADQDGCPESGDGVAFGGEIHSTDPVYFDFNSAAISDKAISGIKQVVRIINKSKWVRDVRVEGYADAIGTPEANIKISRERADAVVKYMHALYLRPDVSVTRAALGAAKPVAPNTSEAGRALNRRVVFHIAGQGPSVAKPVDSTEESGGDHNARPSKRKGKYSR